MKSFSALPLAAVTVAVLAQPPAQSPAMTSLVETERAFARMCVAQGRREAFLAFFGDDAIFFTPQPVNAIQRLRGSPEAETFRLDWEPRFGDVSAAADLGYTTGPFIRTSVDADAKILGTGWYFTIWKKQADGAWKVAVDKGIASPPAGALRPAPFEAAAEDKRRASKTSAPLLAVDRAFCESIASAGWPRASERAGNDGTRLYRDGLAPMVGLAAIRAHFASNPASMVCQPVKNETSRSADLGYTYGTYSIERSPREAGYYLRVWKRRAGEWKLAIDLLIPGE